MAEVRIHGGEVLGDEENIRSFVADYGVRYEVWDIDKLQAGWREDSEESDQDQILRIFSQEVEDIMEREGYEAADVIALYPETENLDTLLAKFDKEHFHTEDEVRFVVEGRGVFTIHGEDDTVFDVEVHPGDLLLVPDGTKHWFTLCEDRTIKCIRLFTTKEGWVAHYTGTQSA